MMGWIHMTPLLDGTRKRWYCPCCDMRKPIEYNPQWVADGKPTKWEKPTHYEWFARCRECQYTLYTDSYGCPNCGCDCAGEEPIEITKPQYNSYYSYEFGVTGYDWEELHQCRKCKTKYWLSNSSC